MKSKEKSVSDMYVKSPLEKLNINKYKYLLGVNKRTSNIAVCGELGRFPVYIDTVMAMIKYWLRLYKESLNNKLLKDALRDNINMMNSGKDCWLTCVYCILKEFNLVHLFHRPLEFTSKHLAILKRSLQGKFVNKLTLELNRSEILRTYRQFKSGLMYEKYLSCVSNDADRRHLSRFRTSSHRLRGWSGGAMVLGKLPVPGRLTNLD